MKLCDACKVKARRGEDIEKLCESCKAKNRQELKAQVDALKLKR